jgi:hypothetical protein
VIALTTLPLRSAMDGRKTEMLPGSSIADGCHYAAANPKVSGDQGSSVVSVSESLVDLAD